MWPWSKFKLLRDVNKIIVQNFVRVNEELALAEQALAQAEDELDKYKESTDAVVNRLLVRVANLEVMVTSLRHGITTLEDKVEMNHLSVMAELERREKQTDDTIKKWADESASQSTGKGGPYLRLAKRLSELETWRKSMSPKKRKG